jgi:hypothetical protein
MSETLKILISICFLIEKKEETPFGPKRVTSLDPYQSIDLIEYYKSYNSHKELGRGRQALEGAKVNIFSIFYNF